MKKQQTEEKRTLFVKFQHEGCAKRITIPSGCKVTFGPLCPGSKDGNYNSAGATALRIYDGHGKAASQLACFVKVEYFYETDSVACISKVTKRATKVQQYEEDGVRKNRNVAVEVSEWKDDLAEESDAKAEDAFLALKEENEKGPF